MCMREDERPDLVLSCDYGQRWPLSSIFWDAQPDWTELLGADVVARLETWAQFFSEHADEEMNSLGSEENRRWFDLEGVELFRELRNRLGDRYRVDLNLWF